MRALFKRLRTASAFRSALSAKPARLLLAVGVLHVALVCAVFAVGRFELAPGLFDANGTGQFAFDGIRYGKEALILSDMFREGGVLEWFDARAELHVRIYSLSYALFGPVLGHSILVIEPLNLFYYLAIVWLVYRIGAETFSSRAGAAAALAVGLWPSFLLHTTQFLKDPLSISSLLAVVLVSVVWLRRTLSPVRAVLIAGACAAPMFALARVKSNMWESVVSIVAVGVTLLIVRLIRERRALVGNLLCAALVCVLLFAAPISQTTVLERDVSAQNRVEVGGAVWDREAARIASRRSYFIERYSGFGSGIDQDVVFHNTSDVVRYLPRATLVGIFAPFPPMWFKGGNYTGRGGRLLSGAEMLVCYFIAALACLGIWRGRRNAAMWLLLLVALANMVALGLIVTNVGALFRLRYAFWMLIIILGAGGAMQLFAARPTEGDGRGDLNAPESRA